MWLVGIAVGFHFFISPTLFAREFIDVFCPDVERKEAILTCAFQAGVEVVFLEEVRGRVNLRKDHVRFEEALSMILKGSGISWFRANGVYYIGVPPSPEALPAYSQQVERYNLKHRKSQEVIAALPQYKEQLRPEGEYALLVVGEETVRRVLRERIRTIDTPRVHILVRALVLECTREKVQKLGFSLPKNGKGLTVGEMSLGGPFERLETMKVYLEGLEGEDQPRLRSEMEVLVLEGEEGEVSTTGEVYHRAQETTALERLDVGTTLKVVPQCVEEGRIQVDFGLTVKDLRKNGRSGLTVVKRILQASVTLREGVITAVAGLKEEEETKRRKVTRRKSSQKGKTELFVFLQAEKKELTELVTIASAEETADKIVVSEWSRSYDYQLLCSYASLGNKYESAPWLGLAFSGQDETSPWYLEGMLLFGPAARGKVELLFRYPLEERAYFALRFRRIWGKNASTVYSLYLGEKGSFSSHVDWHAGLGTHLAGNQELSFVFFELARRSGDLSLKAGLLYQWDQRTSNLWLETEARFVLGKQVDLMLGYRQCLAGEPVEPFDSLMFHGFYAGIFWKL